MNNPIHTFSQHRTSRVRGAIALLLVILFSGATLATMLGGLGATTALSVRSRAAVDSTKTILLADAALDDAIYRIRAGKQIASGEIWASDGLLVGLTLAVTEGVTTVAVFASSTENLARNMRAAVSMLAPPTFTDAVIVGSGGIVLNSNATIIGDVHTNGSIEGYSNSHITGSASAVGTVSSPTPVVDGTTEQGAVEMLLPIIDVEYWKAQANINADPIIGGLTINGSQSAVYGPRKIEGDLLLNSNALLTVTGPLHVTGSLTLNSNSRIVLDESLGSDGTVIVVEGQIAFNSNTPVSATTADPKGYPVIVSTFSGGTAISLNSNASVDGLLYAPNASVVVNSNASAVAVVAKQLILNSNAEVDFDGALAERSYQGGGIGAISIVGWQEIE